MMLFEMAAKYGYPYFANFLNSDMDVSDVRSMAILGSQNLIYKTDKGMVVKGNVKDLTEEWLLATSKPNIKMLNNGKFEDVIDMFEVPYKDYKYEVSISLANGQKQDFSYQHKCPIIRNGKKINVESQDLLVTDKFLLARNGYEAQKSGDGVQTGKLIGYYLAFGRMGSRAMNLTSFEFSEKETAIRELIVSYFRHLNCKVVELWKPAKNNVIVNVFGCMGCSLISKYVDFDNNGNKKLKGLVYDSSLSFRNGLTSAFTYAMEDKSGSFRCNKSLMDDIIDLNASVGIPLNIKTNNYDDDFVDLEIMEDLEQDDDYYYMPIEKIELVESKNDTVYNFTVDTKEHLYELPNGIITHQCCRLRLDLKELRKKNGGLFGAGDNTGSIGVVTLNLPRLAYKSKNKEDFYKGLDNLLNIAKDSLEIKRKFIQEKVLDNNGSTLIPAFKAYVGKISNHFSTIGEVGRNEMCVNLLGKDITTEEGKAFAVEVGDYILKRIKEFQGETGNLYNYEATPAESTSYRLALKDKEQYPDIFTQGVNEPYYTNSCHIPVAQVKGINETFKHQEDLQIQYTGGSVIHIFTKGSIDAEKVKRITKKLLETYKVPYMSWSPLTKFCPVHGHIVTNGDICPECGKKLKMYQRITGYLREVGNFNNGKAEEFRQRNQIEL